MREKDEARCMNFGFEG
uniref:Uncharacterized protein n=1 Tax=Arundo donax TaxID=35708 RepID=A0A0A9AJW9_ARUDO